jgi:dynein light chain Tctex-type 1
MANLIVRVTFGCDGGASFALIKSEIQSLVKVTVGLVLADKADQVKGWCEEVIRAILRELAKKQFQPFKYMANCLILSKRSNGVHTVTMSLWDHHNDGSVTEQWSNESIQCITTVWGLKFR